MPSEDVLLKERHLFEHGLIMIVMDLPIARSVQQEIDALVYAHSSPQHTLALR